MKENNSFDVEGVKQGIKEEIPSLSNVKKEAIDDKFYSELTNLVCKADLEEKKCLVDHVDQCMWKQENS